MMARILVNLEIIRNTQFVYKMCVMRVNFLTAENAENAEKKKNSVFSASLWLNFWLWLRHFSTTPYLNCGESKEKSCFVSHLALQRPNRGVGGKRPLPPTTFRIEDTTTDDCVWVA
jgi:hypothetical protein